MHKTKIFFAIGILVAASAASFYYVNQKSKQEKNSEIQMLNKPIFQPEVQMLRQSQQAGGGHDQNTMSAHEPAASGSYEYKQSICPDSTDRSQCLNHYYQNLVESFGSGVAFQDLKKRAETDGYVVSTCHPITHIIGYAASKSYKTVSEAYVNGDNYCWSGYYHGVMEGIIERIGSEKLPKQLDTICADLPGKASYNFDYYNCVHGLGHGIMELYHDEVFESLHMCDNLHGNWEQLSCQSGVFMENIIAENKNGSSKYLRPNEPLYPCNEVEYKYKDQCYLGQTSYALQVTNYDFRGVFGLCATVEEPLRATCNQSIGRDAANQAMHEKQRTKDTCALAKTAEDETNCVIGAVKEVISYYHDISQAEEYCAIYEGADRQTCSTTAETYYKNF